MPNVITTASLIAVAALFAASAAVSQSNPPAANPDTKSQPTATQPSPSGAGGTASQAVNFIKAPQADTWRASKLIGNNVYGGNGQDIGEVNDVLINRNGQVAALVLDVGGFLGIGGSQVAVPMQSVQFSQAGTTGTGATGSDQLPDRITINVTKQQLETAPKFDSGQSAKK